MALETILTPTSFTSTTVSLPTSAGTLTGYGYSQYGAFSLVPGQKYKVVWNGTDWPVTAMDASSLIPGAVAMGNMKLFNPPGTGEPFLIGEIDGLLMILCIDAEGPDTYTVTIYAEVEDADKPSFEIVLKDRDGTDVVHPATVVRLKTNDGAIRKFVNEDSVPVPVEKLGVVADFSGGDMEIVPDSGNVFSRVTIARPDDLKPENIAKGVNIGGIVGSLAGGKGTTKEIEPDFSGGNQTVIAAEEELWNKIVVKMPGTLKPEHVVDGVNIAGIIGTYGGVTTVEPCVFSIPDTKSSSIYSKNQGLVTLTCYVDVPTGSKIVVVQFSGNYKTQSNTTNLTVPMVQNLQPISNYTVTHQDAHDRIQHTYSATFTTYGAISAMLNVVFTAPGITLKTIEDGLVFHCDNTVEYIPPGGSFQSIRSITEADLLESTITSVPKNAFKSAASLLKVNLPDTVTEVGESAFDTCTKLTEINLPPTIKKIGNRAFYSCSKLSAINTTDNITTIGSYAFYGCQNLRYVYVPFNLTRIEDYTFYNCKNLANITIPSEVNYIGASAFYNCQKLTSIEIPGKVTSIGSSAFYGCSALQEVVFNGFTSVPSLSNSNAFTGCASSLQIKVPAALYDSWKAATNWSTYASKIVAV